MNTPSLLRLWTPILCIELLVLGGLYGLTQSSWSFYLFGPFLLFNGWLLLGPLYIASKLTHHSPYHGSELRRARDILKKVQDPDDGIHAELHMNSAGWTNLLATSMGRKLWLFIDYPLWQQLTEKEQSLCLQVFLELHQKRQTHIATFWASLLSIIPFLRRQPAYSELAFYSDEPSYDWGRLCYKVFHLQQELRQPPPRRWRSCLLFPLLTEYKGEGYFALHKFLRDQLIESFNPKEESQHDDRAKT